MKGGIDLGIGYGVSCKKCQYMKQFMFGMGKMGMQDPLNTLHPKKREVLKRKIKNNTILDINHARKLYRCCKCYYLADRPFVEILLKDRETIRTDYHCPKCRIKMEKIKENQLTKCPCPNCKGISLAISYEMLWD